MNLFKRNREKKSQHVNGFDSVTYERCQKLVRESVPRIEKYLKAKIFLVEKERTELESKLDFKGIDAIANYRDVVVGVSFKVWMNYTRSDPPRLASLYVTEDDSTDRVLKGGLADMLEVGTFVPFFLVNIFARDNEIRFVSITRFFDLLLNIESGKVKATDTGNPKKKRYLFKFESLI